MNVCPKCHKPNVQERVSGKTGRTYLANVETYPSGASYFRSLHTREQCAAYSASIAAEAAAQVAFTAAMTAWSERGQQIAAEVRASVAAGGYDVNHPAVVAHEAHLDAMPQWADFAPARTA